MFVFHIPGGLRPEQSARPNLCWARFPSTCFRCPLCPTSNSYLWRLHLYCRHTPLFHTSMYRKSTHIYTKKKMVVVIYTIWPKCFAKLWTILYFQLLGLAWGKVFSYSKIMPQFNKLGPNACFLEEDFGVTWLLLSSINDLWLLIFSLCFCSLPVGVKKWIFVQILCLHCQVLFFMPFFKNKLV